MLRSLLRPASLLSLGLLAVGACQATVVVEVPTSAPTVRFVSSAALPDFMSVGFPSDAYLQSGKVALIPGMDAVVKQNSSFLQHSLAQMDGFSRTSMALFYVDDLGLPKDDDGNPALARVDAASLPVSEAECVADGSAVFLIDLEATDPSKARVACRAGGRNPRLTKTRPVLAVGPGRGVVLAEGHKYAAVITSRVKTQDGVHLAASRDFKKLVDGDRSAPLGALYGGAYDKVKAALGSALGKDVIVAVAPYTTTKMAGELFVLRDKLEDLPAPTLKWDAPSNAPMTVARFMNGTLGPLPLGLTATLDDWLGVVDAKDKLPDLTDDPDTKLPVHAHDKIAVVGTAEFDAVNYLQVKANGYEDPEHMNFARDASGNPIPAPEKPTSKIWATFFLPMGVMPVAGWPVVIVQHGLSGSRSYALDLANTFCKNGWAVVAIDSVTFGARAADPKYQTDAHTDYEKAPGAKYVGPDGLADPAANGARNGSSDLFGGLKNIGALRDQFRQAALDTAQLVKMLRSNPDLAPLEVTLTLPKIDGAHIAYVGDSLGGIEGATAAAIEPNVQAWTLNVAGGGVVIELGARSPVVSNQLNLAGAFNFGFNQDQFSESHILTNLVQTIADPGDPLLYASHWVTSPAPLKGVPTKARNVLQIEVLFDEVVSNEASEALARAAGISFAAPNVGSNAAITDLKSPDTNPARFAFPEVKPDATGAIKDTPMAGTTAALVQTGPSQHGADLVTKACQHEYKAPWALWDTGEPFSRLDALSVYPVVCPYRELQDTVTHFVTTAFAGVGAPEIKGFKPAVRDMDGDGTPDATDPDSNNPKVK